MSCLDDNTIVAFFDADRSGRVADRIDEHVAWCTPCRQLVIAFASSASASAFEPATVISGMGDGAELPDPRVDVAVRLARAQASQRIGRVLGGKWRITGLLGTGGMAHVFAATHRNTREVALKVMRSELVVERSLVERFLREGYVANRVQHPHAVAVHDDDIAEDGAPFLVMERLRGRTLRERLQADGPLSVHEGLRIADLALDVLAAAHDKGIVHRDVKPENLFETETGAIKVLDFGLARLRERQEPSNATRSGMTMGTVGYMPPEQARGRGEDIDARSDVWRWALRSWRSSRGVHRTSRRRPTRRSYWP